MPIYALGEATPTIDSAAYIHPDAVIIGDVRIGAESSVWPGAVLRGDDGYIEIGAERAFRTTRCCTRPRPTRRWSAMTA